MHNVQLFTEITRHEVFSGEETGATDITLLKRWLKETKRKSQLMGFEEWNCKELLDTHNWDADRNERKQRIIKTIADTRNIEPLILRMDAGNKSGFLIDGWHRLDVIYSFLISLNPKTNFIPFRAHCVTQAECDNFPVPTSALRDRC